MKIKMKISVFSFIAVLFLVGCTPRTSTLGGIYQSEFYGEENYVLQVTFQPEDNTFVEFISNREVDQGTYEKKEDNVYVLKSEKQNIEIILDGSDSFEMVVPKMNDGDPIKVVNNGKTPTYFSEDFDDVEKYKRLLDEE